MGSLALLWLWGSAPAALGPGLGFRRLDDRLRGDPRGGLVGGGEDVRAATSGSSRRLRRGAGSRAVGRPGGGSGALAWGDGEVRAAASRSPRRLRRGARFGSGSGSGVGWACAAGAGGGVGSAASARACCPVDRSGAMAFAPDLDWDRDLYSALAAPTGARLGLRLQSALRVRLGFRGGRRNRLGLGLRPGLGAGVGLHLALRLSSPC